MAKKKKPFTHTEREMVILSRAHAAMMEHCKAGHSYDVVKRTWVYAEGNAV